MASTSEAEKIEVPAKELEARESRCKDLAQRLAEGQLDVQLHEGHQHEQTPHAVDDRGHGGQQFNGDADRPAQPHRREFGQKIGNAEGNRHGEDDGQD